MMGPLPTAVDLPRPERIYVMTVMTVTLLSYMVDQRLLHIPVLLIHHWFIHAVLTIHKKGFNLIAIAISIIGTMFIIDIILCVVIIVMY